MITDKNRINYIMGYEDGDLKDKEILRGLEDMQSRTGSCETCDD